MMNVKLSMVKHEFVIHFFTDCCLKNRHLKLF